MERREAHPGPGPFAKGWTISGGASRDRPRKPVLRRAATARAGTRNPKIGSRQASQACGASRRSIPLSEGRRKTGPRAPPGARQNQQPGRRSVGCLTIESSEEFRACATIAQAALEQCCACFETRACRALTIACARQTDAQIQRFRLRSSSSQRANAPPGPGFVLKGAGPRPWSRFPSPLDEGMERREAPQAGEACCGPILGLRDPALAVAARRRTGLRGLPRDAPPEWSGPLRRGRVWGAPPGAPPQRHCRAPHPGSA